MKRTFLAAAVALLAWFSSGSIAHAQFPQANRESTQESKDQKTKKSTFTGGVGLFPMAIFDAGGLFNNGVAGTQAHYGGLISLDVATDGPHVRYGVGGWYWTTFDLDLYEVHLRAVDHSGLGLQLGHVNTTLGFISKPSNFQQRKVDAEAYDVFVLYNFHGKIKKGGRNWTAEVGLGTYIDVSAHYLPPNFLDPASSAATANYTFYVSGSLQLKGNWSVQASEWLLRDRFQSLNRISLGFGYGF